MNWKRLDLIIEASEYVASICRLCRRRDLIILNQRMMLWSWHNRHIFLPKRTSRNPSWSRSLLAQGTDSSPLRSYERCPPVFQIRIAAWGVFQSQVVFCCSSAVSIVLCTICVGRKTEDPLAWPRPSCAVYLDLATHWVEEKLHHQSLFQNLWP